MHATNLWITNDHKHMRRAAMTLDGVQNELDITFDKSILFFRKLSTIPKNAMKFTQNVHVRRIPLPPVNRNIMHWSPFFLTILFSKYEYQWCRAR